MLNIHWKDWCWSWNSNIVATWCEELTPWKRPWCWERLKAEGEGDDRGWDGWMASPTQWIWVWVNSRSWWWTGRPGVLQSMGLQRAGRDWATELNWLSRMLCASDIETGVVTVTVLFVSVTWQEHRQWQRRGTSDLVSIHSIRSSRRWIIFFPSQLEDPGRFNMQKPLLSLRAEGLFQYFFKGSNFSQYPANSKTSINVSSRCYYGTSQRQRPLWRKYQRQSLKPGSELRLHHFLTVWPRANYLTILSFRSSFCIMVIIPGSQRVYFSERSG